MQPKSAWDGNDFCECSELKVQQVLEGSDRSDTHQTKTDTKLADRNAGLKTKQATEGQVTGKSYTKRIEANYVQEANVTSKFSLLHAILGVTVQMAFLVTRIGLWLGAVLKREIPPL